MIVMVVGEKDRRRLWQQIPHKEGTDDSANHGKNHGSNSST